MKLKIGLYRSSHEQNVKKLYIESGPDAISFYCSVSFCPVLAAYYFCSEVNPSDEEVKRRIQSVMNFYSIVEVLE